MAFGKEAFTDRNGDYKNPTIVDLDKEYGKKKSYELPLKSNVDRKFLDNYKQEQINYILSSNPFHVAKEYPHLILRANQTVLQWDKNKVIEVCQDDNVRYAIYTIISKRSLNIQN